ncbi:hypothetical protein V490_04355 [Pseudogymnoascus sp. VKM F-3557]|nr:hypothetical protein V490_04355 [Pseudogymnoascus sp. VKM F-3557]
MRSVTGCLTCRRRKLKCDEMRPECGRCRKAGRECDRGELVFRHEQNASLERQGTLKPYFANRSSFSSSETWLEIPETVTFLAENQDSSRDAALEHNPHQRPVSMDVPSTFVAESAALEHDPPQGPFLTDISLPSQRKPGDNNAATIGLQDSPSARTSSDFITMESSFSTTIDIPSSYHCCTTSPLRRGSVSVWSQVNSPKSQISQAPEPVWPIETDPQVAFLLRHFSEQPGKWLDLYDLDAYFAQEVPIRALSYPLLKYAACAYAAKHLSRTTRKTDYPRLHLRQSQVASTTSWPKSDVVDWAYYSSKYYAQAINVLRETLQKIRSLDRSPAQDTYWSRNNDQWVERHTSSGEISDETLAAMAILCNFEYMSASDSEWFSHLSGTMLVWNLTQPSIMSLLSPRASKARKAIFWNLFRQDVFAAFILDVKPNLDVEDIPMWRMSGLELDDQGLVLPSTGDRERAMKDDMISNALIRILSKVFNYMAAGTDSQHQTNERELGIQSSTSPGSQPSKKDTWTTISHDLDIWYDGLPDSFRPCARIDRKVSEPATDSSPPRPATIPDIWYTSDMCGSTMQTYHLARMLVLAHRDDTARRRGGVFNLLTANRSIEAELRYHSHEIFGIALSSPITSITLHQTQTIFVAAQCLINDEERQMALDILRRVNHDLGWETEYRIQQLLKEWG